MSLLRDTHKAVMLVFGLMMAFFVLAGPYYTLLDELNDIAAAEADPTMNTFIAWVYPAFYYGFPATIIFGIIITILWLYKKIRNRYYATEEVTYYGP